METYNSEIATNPAVELVQLSADRDEESARVWAKSVNMPWPTLLHSDLDRDFMAPYKFKKLPTYVLIDHEGTELARGKSAAFKKIEELTK